MNWESIVRKVIENSYKRLDQKICLRIIYKLKKMGYDVHLIYQGNVFKDVEIKKKGEKNDLEK